MEEQNAVLERHVDNMESAVAKLESETSVTREDTRRVRAHLDGLRSALVAALDGLAVEASLFGATGSPRRVDESNVEALVSGLKARLLDGQAAASASEKESLAKIKDVIAKMSLEGI